MLPPRMVPRQEIQQYHFLFSGDASRTNQPTDILCALLDHRSLAGEVWMAGDQARRLLEPLEMIMLVHEELLTGCSGFKVGHWQMHQSRADSKGVVDVG
jgi:hypothetical protein